LTHTTLLRAIRDVFLIMARARAAAQLYAELSRKCDTDLADRGLKRSDLPRAAYNELTRER
jgi:hypothetical protein